jgi:phospholipase C
VGASAVLGCGQTGTSIAPARSDGGADAEEDVPPDPPPQDAGGTRDIAKNPTGAEQLAEIDAIVVVMMENRSFDHFLGALKMDPAYAARGVVDGITGTETNPDPNGVPVLMHKATQWIVPDLPHDWDPEHLQWDNGKNDGFVKNHAGPNQADAMSYYDRSQLPFMYWLCDNFTVCDRWYASVLGPTWPNRCYLHASTSGGKKDNTVFTAATPDTVWERLWAKGRTAKNYFAGGIPWFPGQFPKKITAGVNPTVSFDVFLNDARSGTLPDFCVIDPDFSSSDDHPGHDIRLGQAFLSTVYTALASSPQWSRCLLVITYDENGGFFDHVPPPSAVDDYNEFQQYGFRVPAIVVGPTVRRGVVSTVFDHTSVLATLATRFGIPSLGARMSNANDLSSCLEPKLYKAPQPPPANPPLPLVPVDDILSRVGASSQPELERMAASGEIPAALVDRRSPAERAMSWIAAGERLGALKITR